MNRFVLVHGAWSDAAAFHLPSGQSLFGFTQSSAAFSSSLLGPSLRPGDGVLDVDRSRAREVFMADAPADVATATLARLRAEPLGPLTEPVTVTHGRWGALSRAYIRTSADKAVPPAAQDQMVADLGGIAAEATLDCSHMAMLADPGGLAAAILRLSPDPD